MTIMRSLIERRASIESPLRPLTADSLIDLLGGWRSKTGVSIDQKSAIKFVAVYRAISLVSGAIGSMPLVAHDTTPQRTPRTSPILSAPHPDMTPVELWSLAMWHELSWGNTYLDLGRTSTGRITMFDPIPPGSVKTKRVPRSRANPWGKVLGVELENGTVEEHTPDEILHIPGPGYNGIRGLSPIGAAREGIAVGLAAEEYAARLWGSGSLMSGILTTEGVLEEKDAKRIKRRWQQRVSGLDNSHEIAVLDSGAKFQQLSFPPEDAQFIESRRFQVEEVGRLFGVPLNMLMEHTKDTSWGTGIEQQTLAFAIFTLMPWITRLEQRISRAVFGSTGVVAEFDMTRLLRADAKTRAEVNQIYVQSGVSTFDEVRADEGKAPRPGGDRTMIPANFTLIGEDGEPITPPAAPAGAAPTGGLNATE